LAGLAAGAASSGAPGQAHVRRDKRTEPEAQRLFQLTWAMVIQHRPSYLPPWTDAECIAFDQRIEQGLLPEGWFWNFFDDKAYPDMRSGFLRHGWSDLQFDIDYDFHLPLVDMSMYTPISRRSDQIFRARSSMQLERYSLLNRLLDELESGEAFAPFRGVSPSLDDAVFALRVYLDPNTHVSIG
jgi:hypothetical protein